MYPSSTTPCATPIFFWRWMLVYSSIGDLALDLASCLALSFQISLTSFSVSRFDMFRFRMSPFAWRKPGTSLPIPMDWKLSFHSFSSATFQ